MSAALSSREAVGSQMTHWLRAVLLHQDTGGSVEPPSTHRPLGTCTMFCEVELHAMFWLGSLLEQSAVVTGAPTKAGPGATARQVLGVCLLEMEFEVRAHSSFFPAPPCPHGQVYTSAPGAVLKSLMSMHMGGLFPAVAERMRWSVL